MALAGALASGLGRQFSLLPFALGEDMKDGLRKLVWKGHDLGFGPADGLLHMPVDRPLTAANPQLNSFRPNLRERILIARDLRPGLGWTRWMTCWARSPLCPGKAWPAGC